MEPCPSSNKLYLPHYEISKRWLTSISLANPNVHQVRPTVIAYGNEGAWGGWADPLIQKKGCLTSPLDALMGE